VNNNVKKIVLLIVLFVAGFLLGLGIGTRNQGKIIDELDRTKKNLVAIREGANFIERELKNTKETVAKLGSIVDRERQNYSELEEVYKQLQISYSRERELNRKLIKSNTESRETVESIHSRIRKGTEIIDKSIKLLEGNEK